MGGFNEDQVYWADWSDQAHYIRMAHAIYSFALKTDIMVPFPDHNVPCVLGTYG